MIPINRDIFHTDSFCLQCEFYLIRETAWECVLTNSNTEWILQSSALLPLISWIHKCLWIWKTAAGRWSHLPSLHSLWLYFFSCKWLPILVTAMPNFQDRHKSLLLLPSSFFLKIIFYTVWQTGTPSNGWCLGMVTIVFSLYLRHFRCLNY